MKGEKHKRGDRSENKNDGEQFFWQDEDGE